MNIRPAIDSDRQRIFEIRNEVIRTSDAILEDEPWDSEKWDHWWQTREKNLPFLVLTLKDENGSEIVQGYASLSYFMEKSGYRVTGEVSIHIDAPARGKGYGQNLLGHLIEVGRSFGFHSLMSRISGTNAASIRLHEKNGFVKVGHLPKVARKFGNFVDVTLYQKRFTP